jgi:hypothetical protein
MEFKSKCWVIMTKDREVIARGTPRNRELRYVNDTTGSRRILTYKTEGLARAGYTTSWFYNRTERKLSRDDVEPVQVEVIYREVLTTD